MWGLRWTEGRSLCESTDVLSGKASPRCLSSLLSSHLYGAQPLFIRGIWSQAFLAQHHLAPGHPGSRAGWGVDPRPLGAGCVRPTQCPAPRALLFRGDRTWNGLSGTGLRWDRRCK